MADYINKNTLEIKRSREIEDKTNWEVYYKVNSKTDIFQMKTPNCDNKYWKWDNELNHPVEMTNQEKITVDNIVTSTDLEEAKTKAKQILYENTIKELIEKDSNYISKTQEIDNASNITELMAIDD